MGTFKSPSATLDMSGKLFTCVVVLLLGIPARKTNKGKFSLIAFVLSRVTKIASSQ